jgi:antitoxin component of MazEF toxin-antitoxin module
MSGYSNSYHSQEFRQARVSEGDQVSFALSDDGSILIRKEPRISILSLAGIAAGRAVGSGDERAWAKQAMAKKIVRGV